MRSTLLVVLALALALTGCAAHRLNTWVGHPADDLVARMGAPNQRAPRQGGGEVLTWQEHQLGWFFMQNACRRSVVVSPRGVIERTALQDCETLQTVTPTP